MDVSSTGLRDLPATSAETIRLGDPRVLGWLQEAIEEGDRINRADPSYAIIERAQQYITGEQLSPERRKLTYLPQVIVNESRKAIQAHVSALTDLKPVFGWKALNPAYQAQADLLNRYAVAEWISTCADLELGECIKYALAAGTGDLVIDWDPHAPVGGANQFSARDPRDTLPVRPSQARSLQTWEGVILREEHSINVLRAMYPTKAWVFRPSSESMLGRVMGRFRSVAARLLTPADALDQIGKAGVHTRKTRAGSVVLYRAYLKDRSVNLTAGDLVLGTPGSAWQYVVKPQQPIYPRGRLIVATDEAILYDGPNTYEHGLFPVCRLMLWSVPWQFLGIPLFNDLLPVQDAINDTCHDLRLGIRQWTDPDIIYNRNAVSEATMRTLDPRRPGKRIKVVPGFGEPYQKQEGPSPQVLATASELWDKLTAKFTDLSGTANLAALMQLRQLPSADTIQKYYEALTPEIRQEARRTEVFMRDVAEIVKGNYFQFLTQAKRVAILGDAGQTLDDFDYDPGTLVPGLHPGDPGYTEELDWRKSRDERARFFSKQFVFVVAPNSLLAINSSDRRMITMQNVRMGLVDFWTYHEVMETPNVGAPPALPLPPLQPPPPELYQALTAAALPAVLAGMPPPPYTDPNTGKTYVLDPMSGQLLEIRVPTTIVERLIAQQQLGIGLVANSAGRKASGEAPPKLESKGDEPGGRPTVTESKK